MLTPEKEGRICRQRGGKWRLVLLVISIVLVISVVLCGCETKKAPSGTVNTTPPTTQGGSDSEKEPEAPAPDEDPDRPPDADGTGDSGSGGSGTGDSGTGGSGSGGSGTDGATAELEIHFLELGNGYAGDCTLLKTGNTEVLIDAGSRNASASTLVPKIKSYCTDGTLEYVIVTHGHQDHIAAFVGNNDSDGVFANFKCGIIIDFPRTSSTSNVYKNYVTLRDKEVKDGAKHYTALQCWNQTDGAQREYTLAEGIKFEILYQKYYKESASGENNYSVCTLFTQNDYHYLFTGDLEAAGETSLIQENELPECKLFKAGHHGSKTSSNTNLLQVIRPENVCIPCNAGSTEYSSGLGTFPTQDTLNRIARFTKNIYIPIYSPSGEPKDFKPLNGEITVRSNGVDFSIHGSNNDTILKDTDWFRSNRTWPSDGVV